MIPSLSGTFSKNARYRWAVASRVLAASVGGYVLSSLITLLLALLWPLPQAEAVGASTMLSFVFYAALILWVFHCKRLRTVWLGFLVSILVCGALVWWLLPGGGA